MKDKIIITIITILSTIAVAIASPTYKNCGKTVSDSQCTNAACRTDFDPLTNSITNAEMDFDTSQQNGWNTECTWSNWKQISANLSSDGSHINFYPISPLKSLSGLHIYTLCKSKTVQAR